MERKMYAVLLTAVLALMGATGPLPLPDYMSPPFGAGENFGLWSVEHHPEFGKLHFTLYATSKAISVGESAVYIGSDGNVPKYAEWHFLSEDGECYLVYAYMYKSDAWVFERLVIRPIVRPSV